MSTITTTLANSDLTEKIREIFAQVTRYPLEILAADASLEEDLGHVLDNVFIVANSYNATYKLAKEALAALKEHYPEYLLPQVIRQCTKFAQASSEGLPIFLADRHSKGAMDIQALIDEVLKRLSAPAAKKSA